MQSKITKFNQESIKEGETIVEMSIDDTVFEEATRFLAGGFDYVALTFLDEIIQFRTIKKTEEKNNTERKITIPVERTNKYTLTTTDSLTLITDPYQDLLKHQSNADTTKVKVTNTDTIKSNTRIKDHDVYSTQQSGTTQHGEYVSVTINDNEIEVLSDSEVQTIETDQLTYQANATITDSYKLKQWLTNRECAENYVLIVANNNWDEEYINTISLIELHRNTHDVIDTITFTEKGTNSANGLIENCTITELGDSRNAIVEQSLPEKQQLTKHSQWGFYRVGPLQNITKHMLKSNLTSNPLKMSFTTEFPLRITNRIQETNIECVSKIAPIVTPE